MEKTCPRCNKNFSVRAFNRYEWLFYQRLDPVQEQYIRENYKEAICPECIKEIQESFHTLGLSSANSKSEN